MQSEAIGTPFQKVFAFLTELQPMLQNYKLIHSVVLMILADRM